jgi:hypothetical protein
VLQPHAGERPRRLDDGGEVADPMDHDAIGRLDATPLVHRDVNHP